MYRVLQAKNQPVKVSADYGGAELPFRRMYFRHGDFEAAQVITTFTVYRYSHTFSRRMLTG